MIREKNYTDGIFYQLKLTTRYIDAFAEQLFKKLDVGLSPFEFGVMDLISKSEGLCQRDLAKLMLKDRASVGRILGLLERDNYVEIQIKKRNNRIVKMLALTNVGKEKLNVVYSIVEEIFADVKSLFTEGEEEKIVQILKDFRNKVSLGMEILI